MHFVIGLLIGALATYALNRFIKEPPSIEIEDIEELMESHSDSILALNQQEFNEIKELVKSVKTPVLPEVDELIKYLNELPNRVTSQIINSMDKDKLEDFLKK